ncbi:MAG: 30S ribosomal protein S6 [Planctomycetota bacterium]
MADATPVLYEGLFLISQSAMSGDIEGAKAHVQEMLDRAEAEVLALNKWEERKLAYPIEGQKRGTFLISYFKARPTQIANIERDCNLSEQVLRVMFIRADHMGETELAAALDGAKTAAVAEAVESSGQAEAGE